MDENKDIPKKKDTFNYESINEDTINNEKIKEESFILDKVETLRYQKFRENHGECLYGKNGKNKFGAIGGHTSISFTPTGLGKTIICECHGCKTSIDITNYDSW